VEEVFDRATLLALFDLIRKRIIFELKGVISAGKESRVYWGKGFDGRDLAVKIYLTSSAEFRKGILKYIRGDIRFENFMPKSTKKLISLWARKEYSNYRLLKKAGVSVPEPIYQYKNILIMEFIGESGKRAPLLKEIHLTYHEYENIFYNILEDVKKAYLKAGLVHGDLSEYNIMIWKGRHYIIDVSQAVRKEHPNAEGYLARDLKNLYRFFKNEVGLKIPNVKEMLEYIMGT